MAEDSTNRMASYLAEHPRMAGVLFTTVMLLMEAGTTLAAEGSTTSGP